MGVRKGEGGGGSMGSNDPPSPKRGHLHHWNFFFKLRTQPTSIFWYIPVRRMYRICSHFGPDMLTHLGTYYVDKFYDPECSYNLYHK